MVGYTEQGISVEQWPCVETFSPPDLPFHLNRNQVVEKDIMNTMVKQKHGDGRTQLVDHAKQEDQTLG
jgi:hypothetical protein